MDHTTDGSGLSLSVFASVTNGFEYIYDGHGLRTDQPLSEQDAFGNSITAGYNGSYDIVWTDSLGLTALTSHDAANNSYGYYKWTDINAGTQQVNETFSASTAIKTAFGCSKISETNTTGYLLSSINYPDGGTITFGYEPANGGSTGRVQTITPRTGGAITYKYSGGNNGIDCTYALPPTMTRTTQDGTTTYTWALANNSGGNYGNTTKVVDPGGNMTVYTFTGLTSTGIAPPPVTQALTQVQKYQNTGTVSNPTYTLLTTDVICYNGTSTNCTTAVVSYPIIEKDVYHTIAGMSNASRSKQTFDFYGNVTATTNYDFGASDFTWQTTTAYGSWNGSACVALSSGMAITSTPCDIQTTGKDVNGNLSVVSESRYTYDFQGNLLSKSVWTGSGWLTSSATYNANGTVATATDVNGTVATYFYNGAGGCNNLFPTQTQVTVNGQILNTYKTWNCDGGVPVTATDANGQPTQFAYTNSAGADPVWRPLSLTEPNNYATNTIYTPTSVSSQASFGSSISSVTNYTDGMGRKTLTQKQEGLGSSRFDTISRSYGWNGTAFKVGQSMPCVQVGNTGCPSGFSYVTTDPLGRTVSKSDAGGGNETKTYSQNDAKVTFGPPPAGENSKSVQTEFDGLGRVTSVCQITTSNPLGGSSCGQNTPASGYLTSYSYASFAGGTKKVATRGSQTRTYVYDALGRLVSETNPESGTTTYIYDSMSSGNACTGGSYAFNGKLLQTNNANGSAVCSFYDSLGRVSDQNISGPSPSEYCTRFRYDNVSHGLVPQPSGSTISNVVGRLVEAETDNCKGGLITDEWFSYDADGRLTDVYELTPHSGGYYHTTAAYWPNGALQSLSGIPGYKTLTYGLDGEGRPSSAQQGTTKIVCDSSCSAASTTFDAGGRPLMVNIGGKGDNDAYTYDPNTGRMKTFDFTVGSASLLGTLSWSQNGALRTLAMTDGFNAGGTQTCNYGTSSVMGYDDLGRLLNVNCGSAWSQAFSYDQYNNLTKTGSISWACAACYDPSTNRYNSTLSSQISYDNSGELLNDTFYKYTWDARGHPSTLGSTTGSVTCGSSGTCLTYDALGRVVEKSVGSAYSEILYSPVGKTAIMSGAVTSSAYFPLPGGETYNESGSTGGNTYFWHKDWLGSVRLSSSLGNRNSIYDRAFAPYGEAYNNFGNATGLNFTGDTQDRDSSTPPPVNSIPARAAGSPPTPAEPDGIFTPTPPTLTAAWTPPDY